MLLGLLLDRRAEMKQSHQGCQYIPLIHAKNLMGWDSVRPENVMMRLYLYEWLNEYDAVFHHCLEIAFLFNRNTFIWKSINQAVIAMNINDRCMATKVTWLRYVFVFSKPLEQKTEIGPLDSISVLYSHMRHVWDIQLVISEGKCY